MKVFDSSDVRNVALIGHGHCGKTSLTSAMLFAAGTTERHLKPDDGNAITDFDEEEVARKLSITSALAEVAWQKNKINLIDTPGYNIFLNESRSTLIAADSGLVVLDGVAGIEVSTEKVWDFAQEFKLPTAIVINKLDRDRSFFERVVETVHERFGRTAVPISLPIGSEKNFSGVIDVIRMRSFSYKSGGNGKGTEGEISESDKDSAVAAHEALVEMVAEGNDELMEEFFASGTLPVEHIVSGLQEAVRDRRIFPILCVSAGQNIGCDQVLNFIAEIFPSPLERSGIPAVRNGTEEVKPIVPTDPPAIFVFKTAADPFAGRLSYFKVMAGGLKDDAHLTNQRSNVNERLAHIATPFGKTMQPVPELKAGDIGVVPKLKDTLTGDTLCEKGNCAVYRSVAIQEPSIAYAISAKTRNDEDRLSTALGKMLEEDRSLRFYRDPQTKEFLLAGNGQQHL